ncbi:MAG: hypothetical protein AAFR49_03900, partial [Pseudomonadota bacterium]
WLSSSSEALCHRSRWGGLRTSMTGAIAEVATKAIEDFANDVRTGAFPDEEHTYKMNAEEAARFAQMIATQKKGRASQVA